eukprot:jgi/Psemu1/25001/gm1.25001_g
MENKTESAKRRTKKRPQFPILSMEYGERRKELQDKALNNDLNPFLEEEWIWEECLKYASAKLLPDYVDGNTGAVDHRWAMYHSSDIKCHNNMDIGAEVQYREQETGTEWSYIQRNGVI